MNTELWNKWHLSYFTAIFKKGVKLALALKFWRVVYVHFILLFSVWFSLIYCPIICCPEIHLQNIAILFNIANILPYCNGECWRSLDIEKALIWGWISMKGTKFEMGSLNIFKLHAFTFYSGKFQVSIKICNIYTLANHTI